MKAIVTNVTMTPPVDEEEEIPQKSYYCHHCDCSHCSHSLTKFSCGSVIALTLISCPGGVQGEQGGVVQVRRSGRQWESTHAFWSQQWRGWDLCTLFYRRRWAEFQFPFFSHNIISSLTEPFSSLRRGRRGSSWEGGTCYAGAWGEFIVLWKPIVCNF